MLLSDCEFDPDQGWGGFSTARDKTQLGLPSSDEDSSVVPCGGYDVVCTSKNSSWRQWRATGKRIINSVGQKSFVESKPGLSVLQTTNLHLKVEVGHLKMPEKCLGNKLSRNIRFGYRKLFVDRNLNCYAKTERTSFPQN